jgi:hypothetical protein
MDDSVEPAASIFKVEQLSVLEKKNSHDVRKRGHRLELKANQWDQSTVVFRTTGLFSTGHIGSLLIPVLVLPSIHQRPSFSSIIYSLP